MLKPGQIKWYNGRRYRITRISKCYKTKGAVCCNCAQSQGGIEPPCVESACLRMMPADCYPKPDPRTPKRI